MRYLIPALFAAWPAYAHHIPEHILADEPICAGIADMDRALEAGGFHAYEGSNLGDGVTVTIYLTETGEFMAITSQAGKNCIVARGFKWGKPGVPA